MRSALLSPGCGTPDWAVTRNPLSVPTGLRARSRGHLARTLFPNLVLSPGLLGYYFPVDLFMKLPCLAA